MYRVEQNKLTLKCSGLRNSHFLLPGDIEKQPQESKSSIKVDLFIDNKLNIVAKNT